MHSLYSSLLQHNTNLNSQTITGDLGGSAKTHEYAAAVIQKLA